MINLLGVSWQHYYTDAVILYEAGRNLGLYDIIVQDNVELRFYWWNNKVVAYLWNYKLISFLTYSNLITCLTLGRIEMLKSYITLYINDTLKWTYIQSWYSKYIGLYMNTSIWKANTTIFFKLGLFRILYVYCSLLDKIIELPLNWLINLRYYLSHYNGSLSRWPAGSDCPTSALFCRLSIFIYVRYRSKK